MNARLQQLGLFILSAAFLMLGGAAPALAQIQSSSVTFQPDSTQEPGRGIYDAPPQPPAEAVRAVEEANPRIPVPVDPTFDPSQVAPENPATEAGPEIQPQAPGGLNQQQAPRNLNQQQTPGDFSNFRNSNLTPDNSSAFPSPPTSDVDEPSLGVDGRVVFYTGNWFAGFSGDGGQTFDFVDPYDNFPADGTTDSPSNSGTFCCDQVVYYERTHGLMIWLLQYNKSGENPNQDSNIDRIAFADSQEDVVNNNWSWFDLRPGDLGYNNTGQWFDFPDLAVSDNYLYVTTNVFNIVSGGGSGNDTYNSSLVLRIPLDDLADGGGEVSGSYWSNLNTGTLRPVQGAGSRMYFGSHEDNNTLRVSYVDEGSGSLNTQNVDHAGYNGLGNNDNFTANCSDGTNYAQRGSTRILGAWHSAASGEIGFMWNADEGGSFPYPYVRMVRIDASNWNVQQQRSIWNSNHAWLYPSVHVNDRGHLGGTITWGCGGVNWPHAAAWIIDDYSSPAFPSLSDFENYTFASSDDGPNDNQWGDYLTTRRMVPYGNTWVGTGFRLDGGGDEGDVVPEFFWFGRERDMPPATPTIYVDLNNTSGYETGTADHPYNTVGEGEFALQPGNPLIIRTGTYNENVLFDTESNVDTENGSVIIK